jgi:hypothetical protein
MDNDTTRRISMPLAPDLEALFRELDQKKKEGPEVARLLTIILGIVGVPPNQAGSREGAAAVSFYRWFRGGTISTASISNIRRALSDAAAAQGTETTPLSILGTPWCAPSGARSKIMPPAPALLVVSRAELLHALLEGELTDLDLAPGRALFYPDVPRGALESVAVNFRPDDWEREHLALACSWTAKLFREAELEGRARLGSRYTQAANLPWLSARRHWEELDWLLEDNGLKPTGKTGDLLSFEVIRWFEDNPRDGLRVI